MWSWIGLLFALGLALVAAIASKRDGARGAFDGGVYDMTSRSHRRFAYLCMAFAALFAAGARWPAVPSVPILGAFALAATLYGSSFARGFADDETSG